MRVASEVQKLMPRRTFLRRSQIAEGLSRTQGAIGIKVDQHVVHDDRQCGGLRRVVADMREPQGQIELFLRAPAQHFGADRFAVRREDAQRTVFQRGSNADPRAARNGGKQRGGRTDDAGLSFFFEPPARFKQQMPGQRVPAPFQTQAPYGPGKRRSPKAQTGKRFRALGLLQTDFLRTQGIGKPLLFVRKHGQAAREACELRFQDLFVRLAERGEKRRNIGIRPIQIPSRQTQDILQIFAAALERFPFQLCPVPPIKRLGIGHLLSALPDKLSIGERQRVAIARALLPKPELVLADEPTAALDPVTAKNVMRLFTELAGECALVVVSHDHRLVEENGFRCLRLDVDGGDGSINTTLRG